MRHVTMIFLLMCVVSAGSEVYGQNKNACDLVSQADIEAILGQSLHLQSQDPQRCAYTNVAPTEDYERELSILAGKLGPYAARAGFYLMSEDRAKIAIISHCKAMTTQSPMTQAYLTSDELSSLNSPAGQAKTKAQVIACIHEYDAKEISVNRKAAVEYCFQESDYTKASNSGVYFDACMNRRDMLQAMCNRASALIMAYQKRKNPDLNYVAQSCPGVRLNPQEIQAIQAVSAPAAMAELPPKFFAPPNLVLPPGAQLPIPAGTVLDTRLNGGLYAINVLAGQYTAVHLEQALVVGGQTVLPANTHITLKTRIVGPGSRPETLQIGLSTDRAIMPNGKYAEVTSNELVFAVTKQPNALEGGGIPYDTKLRFTSAAPAAVQPVPASPSTADAPSAPGVPVKRLDLGIAVTYSSTPNPAAVEQYQQRIDETTYEIPIAVPDMSDAAFWVEHMPGIGGGALSVFSSGKTIVQINGEITLDQAKALATKALGAATKTGFAYGTPSPFKKPVLGPRPAKPSPIDQLKFDLTAKAEKGSPKAQFALGNFYENGIIGPDGIPKPDYPAAAYWYREASDRGQPEASFALGLLYRDGRGMNQNDMAALTEFRKAATAGFVPAMAQLSNAYFAVKTDTSAQRAQIWAREAAKAGDPEGHLNLGYLWNKGWMGGGKPYIYQRAMEEYQLAAQGGDCVAMMNIGGLYFNGDGVPQDKQQAESWFGKAKSCSGSDLDWMRDKAARYQQKAANGKLPPIPTPPPGAPLVKLGNSILSMMSMTLGVDVLAADSEEKLANLSLGEILGRALKNRKSACALSGFASNLGVSPTAC